MSAKKTTANSSDEQPDTGADARGDEQAPALVVDASGQTEPAPEQAPAPATPQGLTEVLLDEPAAPDRTAEVPQTTKSHPYLLRVIYPVDRYEVPGAGDKPAGGGEPGPLVLTRTWSAVTREQLDKARVATRGTGVKLKAAMPDNEAQGV